MRLRATPLAVFLALSLPASAAPQINVGSNGSDGAFVAAGNVVIDLATQGTYDSANWRVVFNYTSIDIQPGAVVTFLPHPTNAPVVWLSQGDVSIAGTVNLGGQPGTVPPNYGRARGGPGGFRGGAPGPAGTQQLNWQNSGGFGPGGGLSYIGNQGGWTGGGGGHTSNGGNGHAPGGTAYGDPEVTWLVGGSGGGAGCPSNGANSTGGGGGGGAILIASNSMVHVTSTAEIGADGGASVQVNLHLGGGGAGGAIRIVADTIDLDMPSNGQVPLHARGGSGGINGGGTGSEGRIRFEANQLDLQAQTLPPAVTGPVGSILPPAGSPTVTIVSVNGLQVPADPMAVLSTGTSLPDVELAAGLPEEIVVRTTNVALNAPVYLHLTNERGGHQVYTVTDGVTNPLVPTGGPEMEAEVSLLGLTMPKQFTALQVRVVLP